MEVRIFLKKNLESVADLQFTTHGKCKRAVKKEGILGKEVYVLELCNNVLTFRCKRDVEECFTLFFALLAHLNEHDVDWSRTFTELAERTNPFPILKPITLKEMKSLDVTRKLVECKEKLHQYERYDLENLMIELYDHLLRNDGEINPHQYAKQHNYPFAVVKKALEELERRGFIEKETS
jgi:hypothetical protein